MTISSRVFVFHSGAGRGHGVFLGALRRVMIRFGRILSVCFYLLVIYGLILVGESAMQRALSQNGYLIQDIRIEGNVLVSRSDMLQALRLSPQTNILSCNIEAMRQSIQALPNIKNVVVRREFPGTLWIHIEERAPVFRMMISGELLDKEGVPVKWDGGYQAFNHLPVLGGFSLTSFGALPEERLEDFEKILAVARIFEEVLGAEGIRARQWNWDKTWLEVILENGVRVRLSHQMEPFWMQKLGVVLRDLKKRGRTPALVDMMFRDVVVTL